MSDKDGRAQHHVGGGGLTITIGCANRPGIACQYSFFKTSKVILAEEMMHVS